MNHTRLKESPQHSSQIWLLEKRDYQEMQQLTRDNPPDLEYANGAMVTHLVKPIHPEWGHLPLMTWEMHCQYVVWPKWDSHFRGQAELHPVWKWVNFLILISCLANRSFLFAFFCKLCYFLNNLLSVTLENEGLLLSWERGKLTRTARSLGRALFSESAALEQTQEESECASNQITRLSTMPIDESLHLMISFWVDYIVAHLWGLTSLIQVSWSLYLQIHCVQPLQAISTQNATFFTQPRWTTELSNQVYPEEAVVKFRGVAEPSSFRNLQW